MHVFENAGSKRLRMCGDEQALVLASGILDDVRVDVSRVVGLGAVVHCSRRAPHGAAWQQRPWIVIVEPDVEAKLLVVVTVYEVSG